MADTDDPVEIVTLNSPLGFMRVKGIGNPINNGTRGLLQGAFRPGELNTVEFEHLPSGQVVVAQVPAHWLTREKNPPEGVGDR